MPGRQETAVCTCATRQTVAKFCGKPLERKAGTFVIRFPALLRHARTWWKRIPPTPEGHCQAVLVNKTQSTLRMQHIHRQWCSRQRTVVIKRARQRGTPAPEFHTSHPLAPWPPIAWLQMPAGLSFSIWECCERTQDRMAMSCLHA